MRLREIDDFSQFAGLRTEWNALAARQERPSVFLSHEWFDAAWQWRGHGAELFLLCLYKDSRLVAAMPLIRSSDGRRRGRRLEFLTVPDTQFCDILAAPEDRCAAATTFVDALLARRREWDVLRLSYLPEGCVVAGAFAAALATRNVRSTHSATGRNPCIRLDTGWEVFYATRSRSLKKANNLCANRLGKLGRIDVQRFAPSATIDHAALGTLVDDIVAISARSWKSRTGNALDQPGPQAFIRRLTELAAESQWLSIWLLRLDGKPLAMEYQLIADRQAYALRSDFDAAFDSVSPGSHLNRVLLEQMCGGGLDRYFMGPGNNAYKLRWTDLAEPVGELTAYSPTLRGHVAAQWQLVAKPGLRRLRDRWVPRRSDADPPEPVR